MTQQAPTLSKSRFLAGLQCPLRLWYQTYHPDLARPRFLPASRPFSTWAMKWEGCHEAPPAGDSHRGRFSAPPAGGPIDPDGHGDLFAPAVFEAAYFYDGIRVRVDILERSDWGRWNLIEVKSSTAVKEVHFPDVAVQFYVLRGTGITVEKAGILHLNNQYIYDGKELDLQQLFRFADLTEQILSQQEEILHQVRQLKEMLAADSPPSFNPRATVGILTSVNSGIIARRECRNTWIFNLNGITQKKLMPWGFWASRISGIFPMTFP